MFVMAFFGVGLAEVGRRLSMILNATCYRDRAVEYDRLAKKATEALEKRRHENWAAFYRYMAQEAAKREQPTAQST